MKEAPARGHQAEEGEHLTDPSQGCIDVQTLFRAHALFVASFLRRLGMPGSEVDDLVQEVFLIAHRKGGYTPGNGRPRSWLGAIALRVASTSRRTRGRRREEPTDEALARTAATDDVGGAFETRRALQHVQQALASLDLEHRAAFVLYEIEGETCESIAASLGIPIGTVYSRLHHARRRVLEAHAALESGAPVGVRRSMARST
jgi:RNA polymerase sigma-70 factor (ECF subfamily)